MRHITERIAWGVAGALALALVAVVAGLVSAGPLDPTSPPGSTDGVRRPGTPIDHLPFTISAPGSYYFTRNLRAADFGLTNDQNGITITGDGVTLDLAGFELRGTNVAGAGSGIAVVGLRGDIIITNGVIRFWSNAGIVGAQAVRSRFSDLQIALNRGTGVFVASGNDIENVRSAENEGSGIIISDEGTFYVGGSIENCQITNNDVIGIAVAAEQMTLKGNIVAGNVSFGLLIEGERNVITDNAITGNGQGMRVLAHSNAITANHVSGNTGLEIEIFPQPASTTRIGPAISTIALTTDNPFANVVYD